MNNVPKHTNSSAFLTFLKTNEGRTLGAGTVLAGLFLGVLGGFSEPRDEMVVPSPVAVEAPAVTTTAPANTTAPVSGLHTAEWDLPNLTHQRVDFWVDRFTNVPDMREKFEGFLLRSGKYTDMISQKLHERGMPQDLIYLAMIESGFEEKAYSHAAASGLWQFISETGQRYGLDIDRAVDERNDPERATDAALDYLTYLHNRFGSWYLASAAYNTGEGRVGRIMRTTFGTEKATGEEAYYQIWTHLPKETRDYVPLMIAAARIGKDPAAYGFGHIVPETPVAYEEVMVRPATQLADIARTFSTTVEELKELNPQFKLDRTPNNRVYPVRIPATNAKVASTPKWLVETSWASAGKGKSLASTN